MHEGYECRTNFIYNRQGEEIIPVTHKGYHLHSPITLHKGYHIITNLHWVVLGISAHGYIHKPQTEQRQSAETK